MTRDHAIAHLKGLAKRERDLSKAAMPYLSPPERKRSWEYHRQNAQALDTLLADAEQFVAVPRMYLDCPEPTQESDEYTCSKCHIRWDVREDKPACQSK